MPAQCDKVVKAHLQRFGNVRDAAPTPPVHADAEAAVLLDSLACVVPKVRAQDVRLASPEPYVASTWRFQLTLMWSHNSSSENGSRSLAERKKVGVLADVAIM